MDLFHIPIKAVSVPIEERIEVAIDVIGRLFSTDTILTVAYSGGKDSTVLLMLTLWAAERAILSGAKPVIWVLNADTGVESPIIWRHVRDELRKAKTFASERGINLQIGIASPSLSSSWLLRICGGRAMPSFPQNNADCSVEWKSNPMQRLRKRLLAKIFKETQIEACTLVGTRFDESQARGQKMRARGDSATVPVRNKAGDLVLSPLAHWSSDDIWEALAMVRGKIMASYTDTEALFEIYQDAGPTSCAVVNDSILEGGASSRGGCGARTGCWCCLQVKTDASMENFLRKPEYEFMRGLNDLREFMAATQFDLSRRQWVGRTIEHGYIAIRPDAYSPAMMRELFRYVLTIQARENAESQRLGIPPRFQIITEAGVVGVDAMWSLNGFHKAFAAIEDYYDVFIRGVRYDVPKIDPFPQVAMPEPRFLYVGDHWDADLGGQHPWTGMRDPLAESMTEVSGCIGTRELGDGRVVLEVNTEESFSVDEESACLTLDFELDHILGMRDQMMRIGGYTQSYKWWLMHGTISLAKGQVGRHDQVLRRTEFKARHGLCGADYDLNHVLAKSVSWQDVPQEVQEAFIAPAKLEAMKETARLEAERNRQHLLFA